MTKIIVFLIIIAAAIPAGAFIWNESFYLDPLPFLSPIAYGNTAVPIRNDWRGEGAFGARRSGRRTHQGIDLLAPVGTPVRAAKGGLAFSNEQKKGMGKYVEIKHKNGFVTIYSHLSEISIKPAQKVRQGQVIGKVGKTGNARYNGIEPHLHFEIRKRGVAVDPKEYLS
ncbi:MAG: M23 family metallopeptidase [Candidatus Omnitrophica bacterium]|nr:M23 family metallopeptidase [Candidatus Omnitrophota bacterium]